MYARNFLHNVKIGKNVIMGKNNIFGENVIIKNNVKIGNNNRIYDNTIIYPNTVIGNNNIILERNILGQVGVQSSHNYDNFEFKYNGLEIGNNNFFHCNNIIFNGFDKKTIIKNNNKLLAENHIGHDTIINNNVTLYPRCITGGHSILLDNSVMGFYSTLQQRMVLGNYSMIGAGNNVSHNVFPFFIIVNNKYLRINKHAIKNKQLYNEILENETKILELINYMKNSKNIDYYKLDLLDDNIKSIIINFFNNCVNYKI